MNSTLFRVFAGLMIGFCLVLWTCREDAITPESSVMENEEWLSSDAAAANECESQNYHAHGTKLTLKEKVCAHDPNMAASMFNLTTIAQAVLKRFNIDQSLCADHTCNNAEKTCQIGSPKGTLNATSIVCIPTMNTEACEAPMMEFECTIVLSKYKVNVKCSCVVTE